MARKARVEFAGAVYHLLDRGDRREEIFRTDADRELFLKTLGEACERTGWRVHAWALISALGLTAEELPALAKGDPAEDCARIDDPATHDRRCWKAGMDELAGSERQKLQTVLSKMSDFLSLPPDSDALHFT